ncbi:YeaH/YhbH family protein [Rhodovibrio salinarum]|uniref:UPF0229 protein CKO21_04275 n=1 Tax=Rhodovibrio salinarum TaxID=1087 RepID=A0A934QGA4_9PROT|nr:YeaH/YhbH family protein [Rhodovibrio salinarum]MBK1696458.1 hypothetical protein [Rhodovibrio salinarum]
MRIIDRRENPKGKNLGNRQRFVNRTRTQLREALAENIRRRSVSDTSSGETVTIPTDGTHEPEFKRDPSIGQRSRVLPGNKEFREGDEIRRPPQGGGRGSNASEDGEGQDDFVFTLSRDEFLDLLFEDLRLPDMVKRELKAEEAAKPKRAGFSMSGPQNRLNMVRTMRYSLARRAALGRPKPAAIEEIERELERLEAGEIQPADGRPAEARIEELKTRLEQLKRKRSKVPYIDPYDLRYNRFEHVPQPIAQAVMFCLMDVSASMNQEMKELAKRFFMLLHLFLQRHYDNVHVVFIRHTNFASEVDEDTFFHGQQTGGTIVSSALQEMLRVVEERYPTSSWNIYVAQASDGDDVPGDVKHCVELLREQILPITQYMAYVEIDPGQRLRTGFVDSDESDLWRGYEPLSQGQENFTMRRIGEPGDIYPVFHDLFRQEETTS